MFKRHIQNKLEGYVKKYFQKHPNVKLVIVTGSVGKTSTKMAIADVLSAKYKIRTQAGNYNAELSTPLSILGIDYPTNIRSVSQWQRVFRAARLRVKSNDEPDVIVQEVGSDGPGQVPHFGTYATPDIAVVSAVSDEHMEFFKSIENVAREELSAVNFSKLGLINRDDIDGKYAEMITNANIDTYGMDSRAEFWFQQQDFQLETGYIGKIMLPGEPIETSIKVLAPSTIKAAVAAAAVGFKLGLTTDEIKRGVELIRPVSGRMNLLQGAAGSFIIDDTYNSSPLAVQNAVETLYSIDSPSRIVVLGNMNELGETSEASHRAVARLLNPNELSHVITVGKMANQWIADEAIKLGNRVEQFEKATDAVIFVRELLEQNAAILVKGSQGGVYLEELVKELLANTDDEKQLVRQSPDWLVKKRAFFEMPS